MINENKVENYKKFISEDEEIRDGFKVSSNRKKVWNVELGLLEELKKICEKHNIKYYTSGGTTLGAIRHKGFIPRDDDMDFLMFREDYDKLRKVAPSELPSNVQLCKYHQGYSKLINTNTAALGYENWWDEDFVGGIRIDIFPMDYASKFTIINWIKAIILIFLRMILLGKRADGFIKTLSRGKRLFININKFLFKKIDYEKIYVFQEKICKKVLFKGEKIYSQFCTYQYFPSNIFDSSHVVKFESINICIPDGYDKYLKIVYGDYMKPIIDPGHSSRYSVDESYKDIIRSFDKSKENVDNYNNCQSLFSL